MNNFKPTPGMQGLAGTALALMSASSIADLGHKVPSSVSQHSHLHVTEQFIIAPSWLVGTILVLGVVIAFIVKFLRARAAKG